MLACKLYISNASPFTQNSNPVVMCLKLILAGQVQGGWVRGRPKVRIRSQGTVKKDSLIKKFLEKNVKSNVNILVFWANIEQLFRHFQHFFKIRTPGYDSRGLKKIKSPTFPTHSRIPYFPLSVTYRNIPKMSPWAYIFQRPFLRGLFLEGLIFGGAYLRKEICVSK